MFPSRDTTDAQEVRVLPDSASASNKRATTDPIVLLSPLPRQNFVAPNQLIINFKPTFTGTVSLYVYRDISFATDPLV